MSDLVGGLYPKVRNPNAPDYVICKASINVEQFRQWFGEYLKENKGEEWVNLEFLISKNGKAYAKVDDWKPDNAKGTFKVPEIAQSDVPF